ncbi:hypothetical protein DUNSADRAFT_10614 [Dunaliella salina]|uniref:Encoded protein n=1 Tax=Dunaliella salina TaxID=3046 RepID=A0ABQ7GF55_DUNSA|nr:hypothetical protein DUNSADRAFT_10614 [Dunaliella salina]|eukprot:KAF5833164.1 hypothetical protein DUNSADRAFT_10614 [Dunaliella salina]
MYNTSYRASFRAFHGEHLQPARSLLPVTVGCGAAGSKPHGEVPNRLILLNRHRPTVALSASSTDQNQGQTPEEAERIARSGWDPDGLFKSAPPLSSGGGDLFAQREARRRQQQQQLQQQAEHQQREQQQQQQQQAEQQQQQVEQQQQQREAIAQQQQQQQQQQQEQVPGNETASLAATPGTPHSPCLQISSEELAAGGIPGTSEVRRSLSHMQMH